MGNASFKTVGLVTPYFLPQIGGANRYCYELAKALGDKGMEVHLFTTPGALEDPSYVSHPVLSSDLGHDLKALKEHRMDVWHSLFFYYAPLALHKENVFLTAHGDDCYSFQIRYLLPGIRLADRHLLWRVNDRRRTQVRRVLSGAESRINRLVYSAALRRVRRVITVSSFTERRLGSLYPQAAGKICVIPPGVSSGFFGDAPPKRRSNLFLTVCRLDQADRIKNVHGVIEALAGLREEYDFEYVVIAGGEYGNYRKELDDLIQAKGLQGRVRIQSSVSDTELTCYYRRAALFVLAPYAEAENFEGFGIVFLEANASGVPVLTSRQGGMIDYVKEGQNGYFADDPSPQAIRAALRKFFEGKIRFDRDKVRASPEPFRWSHIADRVVEVYRSYGRYSR